MKCQACHAAVKKKEARERAFVESLECVPASPPFLFRMPGRQRNNSRESGFARGRGHHPRARAHQTNGSSSGCRTESLSTQLEKSEELTPCQQAKDEFLSIAAMSFARRSLRWWVFLAVVLEGEVGSLTEDQRKFLTIAKHLRSFEFADWRLARYFTHRSRPHEFG